MTKIDEEKFGTPDTKIAGLQIWIHGYQYAEAADEHDANWLRAATHCGASRARLPLGTLVDAFLGLAAQPILSLTWAR